MAKKLMTSPRGVFVYPRLSGKPDTKFNPEGVWKTNLRLPEDAESTSRFTAKIDELAEESYQVALAAATTPKAQKLLTRSEDLPYAQELDDDGEPTGFILVKFKMFATGKSKKTGEVFHMKPAIFDAAGNVLAADELRIGGGTEGKVSFEPRLYNSALGGAGVTLRLKGAQILKLVEFGGDAGYYGFGDESDDAEDAGEDTEATAATESDGDEDGSSEDF